MRQRDTPGTPRRPIVSRRHILVSLKLRRIPLTLVLALACLTVFVFEAIGAEVGWILAGVGQLPDLVVRGGVDQSGINDGEVWRLVTAGFLHGGLIHLVLNLVGLCIAGLLIERPYGRLRFAAIYATSLVVGNAMAYAFSDPQAVTIGASGAIMGLYGALAVLGFRYPSHRDRFQFALLPVLGTLLYGLTHGGISNAAHIGGFVAGTLMAIALGTSRRWAAETLRKEALQLQVSQAWEQSARLHTLPPEVLEAPENTATIPLRAGTELTLTPVSFTYGRRSRGRRTWRWDEVTSFSTFSVGYGTTLVAFKLTPAAAARLRKGFGSFFMRGTLSMAPGPGKSAMELAVFMNEWRTRWAGLPAAHTPAVSPDAAVEPGRAR